MRLLAAASRTTEVTCTFLKNALRHSPPGQKPRLYEGLMGFEHSRHTMKRKALPDSSNCWRSRQRRCLIASVEGNGFVLMLADTYAPVGVKPEKVWVIYGFGTPLRGSAGALEPR